MPVFLHTSFIFEYKVVETRQHCCLSILGEKTIIGGRIPICTSGSEDKGTPQIGIWAPRTLLLACTVKHGPLSVPFLFPASGIPRTLLAIIGRSSCLFIIRASFFHTRPIIPLRLIGLRLLDQNSFQTMWFQTKQVIAQYWPLCSVLKSFSDPLLHCKSLHLFLSIIWWTRQQ